MVEKYNPAEDFAIRVDELEKRIRVVTELKIETYTGLIKKFNSAPTEENFLAILDTSTIHGIEFGQLEADWCWLASLQRTGLPMEEIVKIWVLKDEIQRTAQEELDSSSKEV